MVDTAATVSRGWPPSLHTLAFMFASIAVSDVFGDYDRISFNDYIGINCA